MANNNKTLNVTIKADDQASKVFTQVANSAQNAANAGGGGGGNKDKPAGNWLSRWAQGAKAANKERRASGENALAKALSSEGGLTNYAMSSLNIGIPAMILDKVGEGLANVTGKLVEMRAQLREGKANWADMSLSVMESLPIIGGFAKAGANINELFTHNKEKIAAQEAYTHSIEVTSDILVKRAAEFREHMKSLTRERWEIDLKISATGLRGYAKEQKEFQNQQEKELHDTAQHREDEDKKLKESHAERQKQLNAELFEVQKKKGDTSQAKFGIAQEQRQYKEGMEKLAAARQKEDESLGKLQTGQRLDRANKEQDESIKLQRAGDTQLRGVKLESSSEWLKYNQYTLTAEINQLHEQTEEKRRELNVQLQDHSTPTPFTTSKSKPKTRRCRMPWPTPKLPSGL